MAGLGTLVNTIAIVVGGIVGLLAKKGLPERFKETINQGLGLAVFIIGLSGSLQGIYRVIAGEKLYRQYLMLMIVSLLVGGVIGELLNIEVKLEKIGEILRKRFSKDNSNFVPGFVTSSLIFCVGAMAIVGSMEDALSGKMDILFAKSALDGAAALIFTATMGSGVIFSALSVMLYQGGLTILAGLIKPWLSETVTSQMSVVGGVLIAGVALNILGVKKIKVGNLLPSIFMPLTYYVLTSVCK